jgi:hypothetical protein
MAMNPDPTNVMGRRIGAVLIDGALVLTPTIVVFSSQMQQYEYDSTSQAQDSCDVFNRRTENGVCVNAGSTIYFADSIGAAPYVLFGVSIALFVVLQGLTGWTIGKLVTGVRLVNGDGRRAGIGRALVRWLLWVIDSLPFLWLVGLITSLSTTGHRRVGDMVAKTFVVRKEAAGHPVLIPGLTLPPAVPGPGWTTAGAAVPTAPVAKHGPQWDEARGTYIQWDPDQSSWVQWDDTAKVWDHLPGQGADAVPPPPPVAPPPPPPPPAP